MKLIIPRYDNKKTGKEKESLIALKTGPVSTLITLMQYRYMGVELKYGS